MVRLTIPKRLARECPTGTREVELREDMNLIVLDAAYLKGDPSDVSSTSQ